jgi:hypothetical protein
MAITAILRAGHRVFEIGDPPDFCESVRGALAIIIGSWGRRLDFTGRRSKHNRVDTVREVILPVKAL